MLIEFKKPTVEFDYLISFRHKLEYHMALSDKQIRLPPIIIKFNRTIWKELGKNPKKQRTTIILAEQQSSGQLLPNDTLNGTTDRICTQIQPLKHWNSKAKRRQTCGGESSSIT